LGTKYFVVGFAPLDVFKKSFTNYPQLQKKSNFPLSSLTPFGFHFLLSLLRLSYSSALISLTGSTLLNFSIGVPINIFSLLRQSLLLQAFFTTGLFANSFVRLGLSPGFLSTQAFLEYTNRKTNVLTAHSASKKVPVTPFTV
jgi:hypothetical protein